MPSFRCDDVLLFVVVAPCAPMHSVHLETWSLLKPSVTEYIAAEKDTRWVCVVLVNQRAGNLDNSSLDIKSGPRHVPPGGEVTAVGITLHASPGLHIISPAVTSRGLLLPHRRIA